MQYMSNVVHVKCSTYQMKYMLSVVHEMAKLPLMPMVCVYWIRTFFSCASLDLEAMDFMQYGSYFVVRD